jgi:voltage-gated potassium channel
MTQVVAADLAHIQEGDLAAVARLVRPVEFGARRRVIRRGQEGDCMYFIVEGEVEVDRAADAPPLRLGPGDFFGEMALIAGEPRNASVSTLRRTVLLRLDVADFRDLAGDHPELLAVIERGAADRAAARNG